MRYELNRDSSGEILRLAIQQMAGHPASFTPWSYAVWFEHLTGINPALSEAMKRILGSGEKLDDETIEELKAQTLLSSERFLDLLLDKIGYTSYLKDQIRTELQASGDPMTQMTVLQGAIREL